MSKATLASLDAPLWSRWFLSLLLPLIAGLLWWEGQEYDSGLIQLRPSAQTLDAPVPVELAGLPRFGQLRSYHADNLYEYINGHAEYYLSAGFKALTVAEYAIAGAQQPQLVVNLYHMGEPLFAFGALMDELAPDAQPIKDLGSMAFSASAGLNLILGPYYAQLSRFDDKTDLEAAAVTLVEGLQPSLEQTAGLDLSFPDLGEPLATYFVKEDYRGLDFLGNVLERQFRRGETQITAFLINGRLAQISETVQALLDFLAKDGIAVEQREFEGLSYHAVDDPYEGQWFFIPGPTRLLGAFAAPEPDILRTIKSTIP